MSEKVLDSSAVLAYLHKEPGWEIVESALQNDVCLISTVNHAEVISKLAEKSLPKEAIAGALGALQLNSVNFDNASSMATGLLRPLTKTFGLSLGDRACLALAKQQNVPVLTADRVWQDVDIGVVIKVIR